MFLLWTDELWGKTKIEERRKEKRGEKRELLLVKNSIFSLVIRISRHPDIQTSGHPEPFEPAFSFCYVLVTAIVLLQNCFQYLSALDDHYECYCTSYSATKDLLLRVSLLH
ncbi:hypothetical protein L228DRAFT_245513 [Xylona heveae TC161]|uniref:Uncharacterized protein n=1 Tax=Xylona heveae (strain CBS 132557 / TC161) TaxID=1328760 RepID=A0A165I8S4_XYLHT|nr:hypothetical protein L228DRAFT_245513 [Xylona heveae TC161]KZF24551.1 hypothetical protein L228DRAFT_245513 [Xylona heveae TC161]